MSSFKRVLYVAIWAAAGVPAWPFGKSIVREDRFDWRVYETEHFDIYYYKEEENLLEWVAEAAEAAYDEASDSIDVDVSRRIPFVLFMSSRHFEQNNISPVSGETVGGFAEPLKRRVVEPYNGSQRQFEKVLVHEITHTLQFELLYPTFGSVFSAISPPDWFMEGLPMYVSRDITPEGEMVLRDAVMTERVPDLTQLNDFNYIEDVYLGYKLGQSALDYLAQEYGEDAPARLLRAYEKDPLRRDDKAVEEITGGEKLADVNEAWKVWLKQRYWPLIGEKTQLRDFASQVTPKEDRRKRISYLKPKFSPSGELVACLTVKDRFLDIFLVNIKTGEKFENLTKGYALSKYDYIMYLENGLSWSPDGDFIAFVGKKDTYDQIYILNVFNRKVVKRFNPRFEDVVSPAYSPDGKKIAFAGVRSDRRDIWVWDVATGELRAVTNDYYSDGYPCWSPDGQYIYYASERQNFHNIFRVRPDGSGSEQLTFGDHEDIAPAISPDGSKMMFVSDREDGIFNIYVMTLATREVGKYTDVVTGVMDAVWSPDGSKVAFTAYEDATYAIWQTPWKEEPLAPAVLERPQPGDYGYSAWAAVHGAGDPVEAGPTEGEASGEKGEVSYEEPPTVRELVVGDAVARSRAYGVKFGPDYLYSTFSYTTGGVLTNYTVFGLSDILGGHDIDFLFDLTSVSSLQDIDAAIEYTYSNRRATYYLSALSWQDYYFATAAAFDRRLSGGSAVAAYPFDYRNRVEYGVYGYYREDRFFDLPEQDPIPLRHDNYVGGLISFVRDTSQWGYYHPTAGARIMFTTRQTAPVSPSSQYYTEPVLDARKYIRITDRGSLAFRLSGGASFGRDPQQFYLGGGDTLRGYPYYSLHGSRFGLATAELRFPVLDYLVFPIKGFALGGFRSLLFADLGSAWGDFDPSSPYYDKRPWHLNDEDAAYDRFTFATSKGGWHLVHAKMAFGTGIRWWLGYFDMRLDWAWPTNLRGVQTPPYVHFTLGSDF